MKGKSCVQNIRTCPEIKFYKRSKRRSFLRFLWLYCITFTFLAGWLFAIIVTEIKYVTLWLDRNVSKYGSHTIGNKTVETRHVMSYGYTSWCRNLGCKYFITRRCSDKTGFSPLWRNSRRSHLQEKSRYSGIRVSKFIVIISKTN